MYLSIHMLASNSSVWTKCEVCTCIHVYLQNINVHVLSCIVIELWGINLLVIYILDIVLSGLRFKWPPSNLSTEKNGHIEKVAINEGKVNVESLCTSHSNSCKLVH